MRIIFLLNCIHSYRAVESSQLLFSPLLYKEAPMKRTPFMLLSMILVLPTVCIAQQKAEQTQDKAQQQNDQQGLGLPAQTAGITEARLSAELYVTRIKKTFKESDSDYQKAKDLYDETYAKYGGWVAAVSLAIKAGDAKNLRKDSEYKRIAT